MPPQNLRQVGQLPEWSPVWLRAYYGARFQYVWNAAHDHFAQYAWDGIQQASPFYAESNSRRELGLDRRVRLFPTEPVQSQRDRLARWLDSARAEGTNPGVLQDSQPFWLPEIPKMRLVWGNSDVAMWTTLNPDGSLEFVRRDGSNGGSNWDWDSTYPFKAEPVTIHRGWVIVYAPPSVTSHPITVSPSETISLGSSLTSQQALDVYHIADERTRAGAFLWGWILAFDPASFDPLGGPGPGYPDGTWHRSYKVDGSFNRLETARYHVERAWIP